ncbi:MAG: energy transducer TonB, partial [Rhodospirillaceae bacterium]|nr:energy transducer TonB [Rhodospirillaceae bacterium]
MRRSTLLWSALAISVVIGLFAVKHRVQTLEDRLHALNTDIITDRDAIQVMEAEWSYLNQPARLEALSKRL